MKIEKRVMNPRWTDKAIAAQEKIWAELIGHEDGLIFAATVVVSMVMDAAVALAIQGPHEFNSFSDHVVESLKAGAQEGIRRKGELNG